MKELEEENKKIKEDYEKLQYEYKKIYEENLSLKNGNNEIKEIGKINEGKKEKDKEKEKKKTPKFLIFNKLNSKFGAQLTLFLECLLFQFLWF